MLFDVYRNAHEWSTITQRSTTTNVVKTTTKGLQQMLEIRRRWVKK